MRIIEYKDDQYGATVFLKIGSDKPTIISVLGETVIYEDQYAAYRDTIVASYRHEFDTDVLSKTYDLFTVDLVNFETLYAKLNGNFVQILKPYAELIQDLIDKNASKLTKSTVNKS
jgi:hypothetical protein